jgi:hypothetical protein
MKLLLLLLAFLPFQASAPVVLDKAFYLVRSEPIHFVGLDYQNLKDLIYLKLKYPEVCLKQVILEQGADLSGRFIRERSNAWNFQVYSKKMKDYKVLRFPTLDSCVSYYQSFQTRKLRKGENYYSFLKRVKFAADKQYIKKLKQIKI